MTAQRPSILEGFDPTDPKSLGSILARVDSAVSASYHQQRLNSQVMESLQKSVETLAASVEALKPLAERSVNIGDSLNRVWTKIGNMDTQRDSDMDEVSKQQSDMRSRVDRIAAIAVGFSLAAGAFSGVTYALYEDNNDAREERLQNVEAADVESGKKISNNDDRIDRVEIHLAGDPKRPYVRK